MAGERKFTVIPEGASESGMEKKESKGREYVRIFPKDQDPSEGFLAVLVRDELSKVVGYRLPTEEKKQPIPPNHAYIIANPSTK